MALTKEQFLELRAKGLTPQQIASFERGEKPTTPKPAGPTMRESAPIRDTFTGLAKSVGKVGLGIGTLGRGIQRIVTPKALEAKMMGRDSIFDIGGEKRAQADEFLRPKSQAEKTSMFVGDVAATAIPSSAVYKATKGIGFATQLLGRGGVGALSGTIQGGGDIDRDTAIGAATEVAFPVAGKVLGYGGNVLKGLAGLVSGKGSDVIEQVMKTPRAALEGGQLTGVAGLKESAVSVRQGVKELGKKANTEYAELVAKAGVKELPKDDIVRGMSDRLVDLADARMTKEGLKFVDTPFTEIEETQLRKVFNNINTWDDFTPDGVNSLARKISRFRRGSADSANFDRVIDTLKRDLRTYVGKVAPTIKEANEKYADKMDLLDQLDNILKTDGAVTSREGIQKTSEAIGRLFNANKDIAREGVEEIERELGINILGKEAGRQLVDGVSRSQSAIGDFATGISRAIIPPKLLLQVTARTGIAKDAIESRLDVLDPTARAVVIEVLTDLFGEGERQDPE
jgi:hypothetical protein